MAPKGTQKYEPLGEQTPAPSGAERDTQKYEPIGEQTPAQKETQKYEPIGEQTPAPSGAQVNKLRLRDFRNHKNLEIECAAPIVLISGANGAGKTNLLEAVSLLSAGRGLRGATFQNILRQPSLNEQINGWQLTAEIMADSAPSSLKVNYSGEGLAEAAGETKPRGRQIFLDGAPLRAQEMLGELLPLLWLTPAMDKIFVEGASGRRKFLDRFAQTLFPAANKHWGQYERAMRERNRLLGEAGRADDTAWLTALEEMMAVAGVAMAAARLAAFDLLASGLARLAEIKGPVSFSSSFPIADIALEGELEAGLRLAANKSAADVEDGFRATLKDMRGRDAAAGRALSGPHRSDLIVHLKEKDMPAATASTGEQKALLLGLLLAQAQVVAGESGRMPLLLLDEVAAHLDEKRRAELAGILLALGGQVWLSGTDAPLFFAMFDKKCDKIAHIQL